MQLDNSVMTLISKTVLRSAIAAVEAMDMRQREQLADAIHTRQPSLLASVLAQRHFGANLEQLEVLLNILLVCYEAMQAIGREWPIISEEIQERCLGRVTGRMGFIEGLASAQVTKAMAATVTDKNEQWLMAFVFGELGAHDLLSIETEPQKYLVLAALNLVECIAEAGVLAGY